MKKYTANYSYSNHNFVIQNLKKESKKNEYLPAICILKNILQRGKPTLLSRCLQEDLGSIHKADDFKNAIALIDSEPNNWKRVIRGDEKGNYYPAQKFYEEHIPKYLSEYKFIQQLIIPEIAINEITQVEVDEYANQQVDFYLPQAYLVIEIDGSQHEFNSEIDRSRDRHLKKYGIETVRIKTRDLESENESFHQNIRRIKERIERVIFVQKKRKEGESTFISLLDYQRALENGIDLNSPFLKATAVIRFQLLILELLVNGQLQFNKPWKFEILERDVRDFAQLSIDDILLWFEHIFRLHKITFNRPEISVESVSSKRFSQNESLKIDFSLCKRYTDEFQTNPEVIYVRTDYLDEYLYFKKGDSWDKLVFARFEPYDYFKISSTDPIVYKLKFGGKNSDEEPLLYLLWNILLQNDSSVEYEGLTFREGQLPIIANALSRNDTIGLLPTGSGKSVCYQLSAILQPAISFVVCPIKSLMYDQKHDLESAFITRINHITSDDDAEDKERIQKNFGLGKYFFIFISPERFQLKTFRQYFKSVVQEFNIAYSVIDEVHCLSEWGHDFRTSYLNLANTILSLCSNFNFLGLTATASINVLKDIKVEFRIKQENVKTPVDYTRKELEFIVIDDVNDKPTAVKSQLKSLKDSIDALQANGANTKCGIIFTPTVNGRNGCYPLSQSLSKHFRSEIKFYSGSVPQINGHTIMSVSEFDEYKKSVQDDFKNNNFSLLTATKAFGMGINKGNIYYTFHYGIPGSMESLYQEAGRAGRDKKKFKEKKAKCFVFLSKTNDSDKLNIIWERNTTLTQIKKLQRQITGDISTNLFLFSLGLDVIKDEYEIIKKLYTAYASPNKQKVQVEGSVIGSNKARTERAIYRLSQLGVIKDWTISSFYGGGIFEVDFCNFTVDSIKESLLNTIRKYDNEFSFESVNSVAKYSVYKRILNAPESYHETDKYVLVLLQWSYTNFAYNRRQSLKNIYENCCKYASGEWDSDRFKEELESYFRFNESSYILQHIAENGKDYLKWFDVFYQLEDNSNRLTSDFISRKQQESLLGNLSRFLESYMFNTGLDILSGLLRLLLDDYENTDGRNRFESSLQQLLSFDQQDIDYILEQVLIIGNELNDKNKNLLAESLYKYFTSYQYLIQISKSLGDQYSLSKIVELSTKRLKVINKKIYGGFSKIG